MNIERTIRRAAERQAQSDSEALPKAATRREKSNSEANAEYKPQGYGLHFCLHNKSYYEVCAACRRTKSDAQRNLSSL